MYFLFHFKLYNLECVFNIYNSKYNFFYFELHDSKYNKNKKYFKLYNLKYIFYFCISECRTENMS